MFTTVEEVKRITDFDVSLEGIARAQAIIESYVGRVEVDVQNATDLSLLGRATAFQAAYMEHDLPRVYGQAKASQIMQYGNMVTFPDDGVSPWIAPLAVIACRKLSWNRIRSVRTGSIYTVPSNSPGWKTS